MLIVDWHVIRDAASAKVFADKLIARAARRHGYNSISNAIDFSVRLVETNAHEGTRKVIDVSGDGPNIGGRSLEQRAGRCAGERLHHQRARHPPPRQRPTGGPGGMSLEDYYGQTSSAAPGSFVEIADETRPFALAARASC